MARPARKQSKLVEQQKLAKGRRPTADDYLVAMRQTDSASKRSRAIMAFGKALRRGDRFQPTWDAAGGAEGVAELMADFSVRDVRSMCAWLGRTASAVNARPERRAAMGELVNILDNGTYDVRPLRAYYQSIVPACTDDVVQEAEAQPDVKWSHAQQKGLLMGHREQHEKKFLKDAFSPDARSFSFAEQTDVFVGNQQFSERVLQTLLARDTKTVRVPSDFVYAFVMPSLKRLLRRHNEATRARFIHSLVQCVVKHPSHFGSDLNTRNGGLVHYVMERWYSAADANQELMEACLVRLLGVFPSNRKPLTIHQIHQTTYMLKKLALAPDKRYYLIRLFIKHLQGYRFDIEDESPTGLARLRELPIEGDKWPSKLFTTVDNANGFHLFERLARVHPAGDFLQGPHYESTVLRQVRAPGETLGDADVLRALLRYQSRDTTRASEWLAEARELVDERKKRAAQSREPRDRAFWAKSAFHLSVATGDLKLLKDVIVWARRFRRDSLTVHELYQAETLNTSELAEVLCAIPEFKTKEEAVKAMNAVSAESITENVRLANAILVELTDTAILDVSEPGFQRSKWDPLLRLPKTVTDKRLARVQSFTYVVEAASIEDPEVRMKDVVWKPTIEALTEVEKHLRDPGAAQLVPNSSIQATGTYVQMRLPDASPEVLAELAQFVISTMQALLGPENVKSQIPNVVEVILRVSQSDNPSLACPFIRHVILQEGDTSSWHRRLLNSSFLSSVPAATSREFLQTMADAMRDAMKAQNSRRNPGQAGKSVIKVSTIKMLAQLMQGNVFVAPVDACNILTSLLSEARHIDSQLAIIAALMKILTEPNAPGDLRQLVLDSIETHAVPVMGQLSERHGVTEAEWEEVSKESSAPMPDVGEDAPLLKMLIREAQSERLQPDDRLRLVELITSAFELSGANNRRWLNLFLAKNGFSLDGDERMPTMPVHSDLLAPFFQRWILYMPKSIFDMVRDLVLIEVDPPASVTRIIQAVKANPKLVTSPTGQHWLAQFDRANNIGDNIGISLKWMIVALSNPPLPIESKPGDQEEVYIQTVQELILTAAERLIRRGKNGQVLGIASQLTRARFEDVASRRRYQAVCLPVVHNIIAVIEAIRRDRAESPTTGPLVLPNTFRIRAMILPLPRGDEYDAKQYQTFVSAVTELIDHLSTRRLPYHDDFKLLVCVTTTGSMRPHLGRLALQLARLDEVVTEAEPSLGAYLRLELVAECIMSATPDEQVQNELVELLEAWKGCWAEGLRKLTVKVDDKLTTGWLPEARKRRAAMSV